MNHKVNSVADLYDSASNLLSNAVMGQSDTSADTIIANLESGIEKLKNSWEGKDAGVQIQNTIGVLNAMVGIRNALGKLASDSSKVASNYREIQNSNGAGLEALGPLNNSDKTKLADYSDTSDKVGITEGANEGKSKIDIANNSMDGFISEVRKYYDAIMQNWTAGTGRDNATQVFEEFLSNSAKYKEVLNSVSSSVSTAINNYKF